MWGAMIDVVLPSFTTVLSPESKINEYEARSYTAGLTHRPPSQSHAVIMVLPPPQPYQSCFANGSE